MLRGLSYVLVWMSVSQSVCISYLHTLPHHTYGSRITIHRFLLFLLPLPLLLLILTFPSSRQSIVWVASKQANMHITSWANIHIHTNHHQCHQYQSEEKRREENNENENENEKKSGMNGLQELKSTWDVERRGRVWEMNFLVTGDFWVLWRWL